MEGIYQVLLIYDIMCQWQAKFRTRFEKEPYLNLPDGMTVKHAIGDMHIHGHVRDCFPKYSLSFADGAGVVDGEILETNWAVLNEVSGTVRGASLATRSEVIDGHVNYLHFKKVIYLSIITFPSHSNNELTFSLQSPRSARSINGPKTF